MYCLSLQFIVIDTAIRFYDHLGRAFLAQIVYQVSDLINSFSPRLHNKNGEQSSRNRNMIYMLNLNSNLWSLITVENLHDAKRKNTFEFCVKSFSGVGVLLSARICCFDAVISLFYMKHFRLKMIESFAISPTELYQKILKQQSSSTSTPFPLRSPCGFSMVPSNGWLPTP